MHTPTPSPSGKGTRPYSFNFFPVGMLRIELDDPLMKTSPTIICNNLQPYHFMGIPTILKGRKIPG